MNAGESCRYAQHDAAYVLGALSAEERLEFERHLPGCPSCSRAVRQFAGLPGLLAQVSPDVLEAERVEEPLPETLLPALVQEVRRTRRRRRWGAGLAAAAAVVVIGAASVVVVRAVDDAGPPSATPTAPAHSTPAAQEMSQVGQTDVAASVALTSVAWGTRLDLVCTYAGSDRTYAASATYALVVRDRAGDEQQVATWRGLPGRTMSLAGATALTAADIAVVEVRDAGGHPILEVSG